MTKKRVYILSAALLLLLMLIWAFWPEPVPVRLEQARYAGLEVTFEEEGRTRVTDRYIISAPVTGYARRLQYKVGDSIRPGQELLYLQPVPDLSGARQQQVAQAALAAARNRLEQARQQRQLAVEEKRVADLEYTRLQQLFTDGYGSRQGLDHAELAAKRADAQFQSAGYAVQVAESEVEAARLAVRLFYEGGDAGEVVLRAPAGGQVLRVFNESEGIVQPGSPLIEIGDPSTLEVVVEVLSSDAVQVGPGTPVRLKRWGRDEMLNGQVIRVEPAGFTRISALGVEEQRVPVIVAFNSPRAQWERLGDGYRVVSEFIIWQHDQVLQVPSSALFRTGGRWALFVEEQGRARLHFIEVGHQSGLYTEVESGVSAGMRVISHPDERIEDGVRVAAIGR